MPIKLFQTEEYKTIMVEYISKTIRYLFDKNQEFALACEIKHITFNPALPTEIEKSFDEVVLFILSGYTFETATLEDEYFSFEAGFGAENFGSTVTIPLLVIKQILVNDTPIVLNLSEYQEKTKVPKGSNKNSMEALLKNPENKKLLRKRKE